MWEPIPRGKLIVLLSATTDHLWIFNQGWELCVFSLLTLVYQLVLPLWQFCSSNHIVESAWMHFPYCDYWEAGIELLWSFFPLFCNIPWAFPVRVKLRIYQLGFGHLIVTLKFDQLRKEALFCWDLRAHLSVSTQIDIWNTVTNYIGLGKWR